ncbi:T6SS immunity protein Tdi1 domain-containing protein [Fictibacillus phosphorivorans]|uniref:T6SS immunity protein Tdi1 domain-containing protein n=1 Tax=Fictibacillus phosphorivorans TaxID=1221500 RepID=UPI0011A9223B|nr:T6SS immunity protein Tdi1 domain-containing protein [Fictibacillus phosphorivorans]
MDIFKDFKKVSEVEEYTINKYKDMLPEELIAAWKTYGYGTFMNGYLKIINPDEYKSIVNDSYLRSEGTTPIFTTSMGDVILFEKDENQESYIVTINYRKGNTKVVASKYSLFLRFLEEKTFKNKALDWSPYPEAIEKYKEPEYEYCFGYTPLLGLGGEEKVDHLKKVNLKEHILIINEFMGPVE